jgi:hypothetical protein
LVEFGVDREWEKVGKMKEGNEEQTNKNAHVNRIGKFIRLDIIY